MTSLIIATMKVESEECVTVNLFKGFIGFQKHLFLEKMVKFKNSMFNDTSVTLFPIQRHEEGYGRRVKVINF
jgi:hypothetical protein